MKNALLNALVDFYAPGLAADTFVARTFALTSRLIPLALNSHGVIDKKTGLLTANFDSAPAGIEEAFGAFGRLMHKYPAFRFDPSVSGGKPFSARDHYSRPAFHDLDIYQDVYRPMRFVDHCFVHVPSSPAETVVVGFMRDGQPFTQREKALLEQVQPHLANGRKLALAVTEGQQTPAMPELFSLAGFTARECDVLAELSRGSSNQEIATRLKLRDDSVSRHLRSIYLKLGVENRVGAALAGLSLARKLHARRQALRGGALELIAHAK